MSLRSPLGRVLGLGSARDGTDHWWGQRISGVALVLLGSWFAIALCGLDVLDHGAVTRFIGTPLNTALMSLLCVTVAYHSYLGVQVVIEDYVHTHGLKIASLVLSRFVHVFVAVLSVFAVARIGLGA